jgi:hypothetical protein
METKEKFYVNKFSNVFSPLMGTPMARIQYVNLVNANVRYAPAKFGCVLLFDKSDPAVKAALNKMIISFNEMKLFAESKGIDCSGFTVGAVQDGDSDRHVKYQGYKGHWFISPKNALRPEYIDSKQNPIDPALLVPGVLVRAVVGQVLYKEGCSYKLSVVQLVRDDGTRLIGGTDPKSLLTAMGEDEGTEEVETPVAKPVVKKVGKAAALDLL